MTVTLRKAKRSDCVKIHEIQIKAFASLLKTYQDFDSNPGAESRDQILRRFMQPFTDYYLIDLAQETIGALRVCNFGEACRLSPICILPEFQGHGYAQQAIIQAESFYPNARRWTLDTIAQEEKLCYLYEKLGFRKTGETRSIKEGMDLIFYAKEF